MEVIVGSNIIRNTSGVLNVSGKDQIGLEVDEETTQLLLTMDIYNPSGKKIAKLRRNAWVFNEGNIYDITTVPDSLKLFNKKTGKVVVEVRITGKDKIEIPYGWFYTSNGNLLEITPEYWKIGGITMSGNVIDSCGAAVGIG
jgi:transcription antitermination factor NusG